MWHSLRTHECVNKKSANISVIFHGYCQFINGLFYYSHYTENEMEPYHISSYFLNFNLTDYYSFSTLKEYMSRKSLGNNENITSSHHSKYTKKMSRSSQKIRTKFLSEKHLHMFNTYQKGFVEYSTFSFNNQISFYFIYKI